MINEKLLMADARMNDSHSCDVDIEDSLTVCGALACNVGSLF